MGVKRALATCGLTGVLAALAFAAPARAAGDVSGKCLVTGKADADVHWVGGPKDAYHFESLQIVCVGTEDVTKPVVLLAEVESAGSFVSMVCGTGIAKTAIDPDNTVKGLTVIGPLGTKFNYWSFIENLKYAIGFVGGVGQLFWHDDVGKVDGLGPIIEQLMGGPIVGPKNEDKPNGSLAGVIQLLPPDPNAGGKSGFVPGNPPDDLCTHGFTVTGVVDVITF